MNESPLIRGTVLLWVRKGTFLGVPFLGSTELDISRGQTVGTFNQWKFHLGGRSQFGSLLVPGSIVY